MVPFDTGERHMLKRPKTKKLPNFAVRFVGYSAHIIARKGNTDYARLDFVTGVATLLADEGWLRVPNRTALASFFSDLPASIGKLRELVKSVTSTGDGDYVEMRCGEAEIRVKRVADIDRFVSQIARRHRKIEPILEQAEKVGSAIKRLPYDDYVDEIAKTGVGRVVFYGYAFFVDGKLSYHPEHQTILVEPSEDERTFLVSPMERLNIQ
jgi:hypothetical protein